MALKIDSEVFKHVLKTLKERFEEEALNNSSTQSFPDTIAKIQHYTGLSKDLIEKLINESPGQTKLNLASRMLILNTVKGLYEQSQLPTYNVIFEETRNKLRNECDEPITEYKNFLEVMDRLGYMLKETTNNSMIVIEDAEVRFERFLYLQRLKRFRSYPEERPQIVYVDERIVSLTKKYEKPMLPDSWKRSNVSEERIFYHAVSSTGFITGMFSNQPDWDKFITDILLPLLSSIPSVIIIDTFHGDPENDNSMTKFHSKSAMFNWLISENTPCRTDMSQPELYELIDRRNIPKQHHIVKFLRRCGHHVLRLPRYFRDLSITTSLWNSLEKEEMGVSTTLADKQNELLKKISSVPKETWLEYESELIRTENCLLNIENTMDNLWEKYELKL